jgi:hypothetical protein
MELIVTILALVCLGIGLLILFPPETEMDRSIKDAMTYPAKKEAMGKAIRGEK